MKVCPSVKNCVKINQRNLSGKDADQKPEYGSLTDKIKLETDARQRAESSRTVLMRAGSTL